MLAATELTPELLELHAALDVPSLWKATCALFERATANHFIVAGLRAERCRPTIVLRSRGATPSTEWYEDNLANHPGFDFLREHPGTRVVRASDIMSTAELKRHEYYHRFIAPDGWLYSLALCFWHGSELHAFVGINRSEAQGDFSEAEMANALTIYPHLQVAFTRVSRLHAIRTSERSMMRLLMDLPLPTLLADWDGHLTYCNRDAAAYLKVWDSGSWTSPVKRRPSRLPVELRQFCARMRERVETGLVVNQPAELDEPLVCEHPSLRGLRAVVEVLQVQRDLLTPPGFLIRLEGRPHSRSVDRALPQLMPLTPRERELALLVCEGKSNEEMARSLNKTLATVKTQLQSIFQKLNVRNRTSLTALLRPVAAEAARA